MAQLSRSVLLALSLATVLCNASRCSLPILGVPDDAWEALNSSLSGRLHAGRPVALPCFRKFQDISGLTENPIANEARCDQVQNTIATSADLIRDFGSYHNPTFSTCMAINRQCTLSASRTTNVTNDICYQGAVPDFYIDAREVKDIQLGLQFARERKIPITIKNTGHDYKGRSTGPNTLAIWYVPVHSIYSTPSGH
jgi:hypothetical protein